MTNNQFEPGTAVIVWGRPRPNLILLFGEGIYESNTFINGNYWPTVRLQNGREITVHQAGISIGRSEAVAKTCKAFGGHVVEWDLDTYLQGHLPDVAAVTPTNGTSQALPPPKTATDKVMYLKREIELEEGKKQLHLKAAAECDKAIAAKRAEINTMTQTVLGELAAVNPNILELLAAQVAEKMNKDKFPSGPPTEAPPIGVTPIAPVTAPFATPVVTPPPAPMPDVTGIDHNKLATED